MVFDGGPLIMGNDLRNVSDASLAILRNKDAIAVNQDRLAQMGIRVSKSSSDPLQVWARNLADGGVAVGLYNKLGKAPADIKVCLHDIGMFTAGASVRVTDVWSGGHVAVVPPAGCYTAKAVKFHDTAFLRFTEI